MSRHDKQVRRKRRREKRKGREGLWKLPPGFSEEPVVLQLLSYDITFEPIKEHLASYRRIETVLDEQEKRQLHGEVHDEPRVAIGKLERLIEQFPDVPVFYNWLASACGRVGDHKRADELSRLNYEQNPGYLFARLNYAQTCVEDGDVERAAEVMDHKFDLKALHPERNVFHISEFLAMSALGIEYYLKTGHEDSAQMILDIMEKIAPDFEQTLVMRKRVDGSILMRALRRLVGKFGGIRQTGGLHS